MPTAAFSQVSPEEHAKHHPGQAEDAKGGPGMGGPPEGAGPENGMGGKGGGMMGGGMGGMMDGMMEKMSAPKPKDLYPSLMELPDLPMERRGDLEQEAHGRMIAGTRLLSEGFDELSRSAAGDDFVAMQAATAKIREGLNDFESGLAAHRALREGKAWEQHVRRPHFQQVERPHWESALVYFPRLLPVIVSFEKFNSPEFSSAFPSLQFPSLSGFLRAADW